MEHVVSIKQLTVRERQVLELLWDGLTVKEIAGRLAISPARVCGLRRTLGWKLEADNAVSLVRTALERGLIRV